MATPGESCDSAGDCAAGLVCTDSLCAPLPQLGQGCPMGDCAEGLICEELLCVDVRYPGESCGDQQGVCAQSICVDSVCQPRVALGGSCAEDDECASRQCDLDICVDPRSCLP